MLAENINESLRLLLVFQDISSEWLLCDFWGVLLGGGGGGRAAARLYNIFIQQKYNFLVLDKFRKQFWMYLSGLIEGQCQAPGGIRILYWEQEQFFCAIWSII